MLKMTAMVMMMTLTRLTVVPQLWLENRNPSEALGVHSIDARSGLSTRLSARACRFGRLLVVEDYARLCHSVPTSCSGSEPEAFEIAGFIV